MKRFIVPFLVASLGVSALNAKETIRDRIIYGSSQARSPAYEFEAGEQAITEKDYSAAREHFRKVIAAKAGPHNPHYFDAADYINIGGKDKLFKLMVQDYSKIIDVEASDLAYINADLRDSKKYPAGSTQRKTLEEQVSELAQDIQEKKDEICTGLSLRGRSCK